MRIIISVFLIVTLFASFWYTRSDEVVILELSYMVPLLVDKPVQIEELRVDIESKIRRQFPNADLNKEQYDIDVTLKDTICGVEIIRFGKIDIQNGMPGLNKNTMSLKTIGRKRFHAYTERQLKYGELEVRLNFENQKLHDLLMDYLNKH
jgi:hypothetical protein